MTSGMDTRNTIMTKTAVLELLEASETRFTPWDWKEVAA